MCSFNGAVALEREGIVVNVSYSFTIPPPVIHGYFLLQRRYIETINFVRENLARICSKLYAAKSVEQCFDILHQVGIWLQLFLDPTGAKQSPGPEGFVCFFRFLFLNSGNITDSEYEV